MATSFLLQYNPKPNTVLHQSPIHLSPITPFSNSLKFTFRSRKLIIKSSSSIKSQMLDPMTKTLNPFQHPTITFSPNFIRNHNLTMSCSSFGKTQILELNPSEIDTETVLETLKPLQESIKCSFSSKTQMLELTNKQTHRNPFKFVLKTIEKALKTLVIPSITVVLLGLLLFCGPNSALAISGGRMGGSSFSSGGRMGGSSFSSGRSYSRSSSFRISGGRSYRTRLHSGSEEKETSKPWWQRVLEYIKIGFQIVLFFFLFLLSAFAYVGHELTCRTKVIKLQVCLLGSTESLQRDLNRIAETADTSKKEGMIYILKESTLALLGHLDYCISAYSSVDFKSTQEYGKQCFDKLSNEECQKFDEETLVNVDNVKKQSISSKSSSRSDNEYIVVTILVVARHCYPDHISSVDSISSISSRENLKAALEILGAIPEHLTLAVEVLWAPQQDDDVLTESELRDKYPQLQSLQ